MRDRAWRRRAWPRVVVLGPLLVALGGRGVQAAEPAAVAAPSRMDQVQREAVNPLRRILEAGTPAVVRTRVKTVEAPAPARSPAAAAGLAAGPSPAVGVPQAAAPAVAPVAARAVSGFTGRPANIATAPAAGGITETVSALPVADLPRSAGQAAPPVAAPQQALAPAPEALTGSLDAPALPAAAGLPVDPPDAPSAVAAGPAPLELVSMIEPALPARVRERLSPQTRVMVALMVEPDGQVSQAAVQGVVDRQLASLVVAAVRQWRYAPVAQARRHLVELVLTLDN